MPLDYTTYLLSGLIPWMAFQESMSKGATVIVGNANLVKQVVFPDRGPAGQGRDRLVLHATGRDDDAGRSTCWRRHHGLPWTYALLPGLFFFQALAMIGVAYTLAAVGAYFRDLKDFVQVFCIAGMYLMPVVYLPTMVPRMFRPLVVSQPFQLHGVVLPGCLLFRPLCASLGVAGVSVGFVGDVLSGLSSVSQDEDLFRERAVRGKGSKFR